MGKLIIISAPSGTGKSTIISRIIDDERLKLAFSVSATTRSPRDGEVNGVNYYFMTVDEFEQRVKNDEFAEYQQVYEGRYYGTLKCEIERIMDSGRNVVLDIDVLGGINVKKIYGDRALALYILPPSMQALRERLEHRGTDSSEEIEKRVAKAEFELGYVDAYDKRVVNDVLDVAVEQVRDIVTDFVLPCE